MQWEYKEMIVVPADNVTPGKIEEMLNDMGRQEWECVAFQSHPAGHGRLSTFYFKRARFGRDPLLSRELGDVPA